MKNIMWLVWCFPLSRTLIFPGHNCTFSEFSRSFKAATSSVYSSSHRLLHKFLNCYKIKEEFAALHILTSLTKSA